MQTKRPPAIELSYLPNGTGIWRLVWQLYGGCLPPKRYPKTRHCLARGHMETRVEKGWRRQTPGVYQVVPRAIEIRPIHELRIWIAEGLTQADSLSQGVELPGPWRTSQIYTQRVLCCCSCFYYCLFFVLCYFCTGSISLLTDPSRPAKCRGQPGTPEWTASPMCGISICM